MKRGMKGAIGRLEREIRALHYASDTAYDMAIYDKGKAIERVRKELAEAYRKLEAMKIEYATAA